MQGTVIYSTRNECAGVTQANRDYPQQWSSEHDSNCMPWCRDKQFGNVQRLY